MYGSYGVDIIYNHGIMIGDVNLFSGNDFYNGVGGTLTGTLSGGEGFDTVSFAGNERAVVVDLSVNLTWDGIKNQTILGFENAVGTSFDDKFYGNGADNTFDGGPGGSDLFYGGTGSDTVSYLSSIRSVIIDLAVGKTWDGQVNDFLDSIENATGSAGNDVIYGNGGRNTIDGGPSGADTLYGGDDVDTLFYASSTSTSGVIVDLPSNLTWDGANNDRVFSFENVVGSNANDRIIGTVGANVIAGGSGSDTLTGGQGADTFVYNALSEGGDTITDFAPGSDHLQFSKSAFSSSAVFMASGAPTRTRAALRSCTTRTRAC